jgi:3-oxoacyl-(acyl-carrier-protein) synthase
LDGRFEVRSGGADGASPADAVVHCSGGLTPGGGDWQPVDHAGVRGRVCAHVAEVGMLYAVFDATGLQYGPGYRTLEQAWCGGGSGTARLRVRSAQGGTKVHPADLDDALCLGAIAANDDGGGETWLPFAVDEALLQGGPGDLWAVRAFTPAMHPSIHVCPSSSRVCVCACVLMSFIDGSVCLRSQVVAQQGAGAVSVRLGALASRPQAQLEGFKSRALRATGAEQRHLYVTEWRSLSESPAERAGERMVLLGSRELASEIGWASQRKELMSASSGGVSRSSFAAAVAVCRGQASVQELCALETSLALVQTQAVTAPVPSVWLLTVGVQLAQGTHGAVHAGAWGLARSARVEAQLPLRCADGPVDLLIACGGVASEPELVLRAAGSLAPRLAHAPRLLERATFGARVGEWQIVTGGTGGLGLLTGRWLAENGAGALVAASRSGTVSHSTPTEWERLCASGATVVVQQCDTSEPAHVRRLVALTQGPSSAMGVWHAAGLLSDGVLPKQGAQSLARVYASKAYGGWLLQLAYAAAPLRTCALFSSVAALFGGAGQANYSAANACLDALATHRHACGRVAVSMQWGAWAEVGMAARGVANERMAAMEAASGFGRISPVQGLAALQTAVMPHAPSLLGMAPVQWSRMLTDGAIGVPAFLVDMIPAASVRSRPTAAVQQAAGSSVSLEAVLQMVRRTAGSAIDADAPLMEAGVDSLGAVELRNQLQRAVGDDVLLSSTLMFDHPTARQVAVHLQGSNQAVPYASAVAGAPVEGSSAADVEVTGLSVTLPAGVGSFDALREMIGCGRDLVRQIPATRWDVEQVAQALSDSPPEVASRVRHGAFLQSSELFAHRFFSISAAEASAMDPQQRQLLERGYAALHAAGNTKASLLGAVIGVSVGQWASEFDKVLMGTPAGRSVYASTGFACSVTCGRVSFVLGLQGPCASFDTACSASLVGNHSSMRALQRLECESALSAGVNMILDASTMRGNAVAGFTSVRGRSHTFDSRADGYARGEAISAIVCQLSEGGEQAVRLLGSAIRQDGRSASLTAPNGQAQQRVLTAALSDARLAAEQMSALEAHGTGTALGDPIEAGAAAAVFLVERSGVNGPLAIGSLKANAGHTEPGAGLSGALKLMSQLQDIMLPPNAQLRVLNPHVAATLRGRVPCALPTQVEALPVSDMGSGLIGGVSSFGYSGTIAHAVMRGASGAGGIGALGASLPQLTYHRRAFPWRGRPHPFLRQRASPPGGGILFRSSLSGATLALVVDHVVQSRVVFPGAGYLELARAAACAEVAAMEGAALRGVFFLQPLAIEAVGMYIECTILDGRFEVRSGSADGASPADAAVHCSGGLTPGGSDWKPVDHAAVRSRVCAHVAEVGMLYAVFDATGLQYGPGYRTLERAWCGGGSGTARLRVRSAQEGTKVHPADLDDALCVSLVAASDDGSGETRLPFAVDEALLQGGPGDLWAVRAFTPLEHACPSPPLTRVCVCVFVCVCVCAGGPC